MNSELIQAILFYYAIIWSVMTPAVIIAAFIINKKSGGELIRRYDAFFDRLAGIDPKAVKEPAASASKEGNGQQETAVAPSVEGQQEQGLIARFVLMTGDVYHCNISTYDYEKMSGAIIWSVRNDFAGTIDRMSGEFSALREGVAEILCNGKPAYVIRVTADDGDWKPGIPIGVIASGGTIDDIFSTVPGMKRLKKVDIKKNRAYYGSLYEGHKRSIYGYGNARKLERVISEWTWSREREEDFIRRIGNRAMPVNIQDETGGDSTKIWVHVGKDKDVDACVMLRRTDHGTLLLGICSNWRKGGVIAEIQMNPSMIMLMFADLMPEEFKGEGIRKDGETEKEEETMEEKRYPLGGTPAATLNGSGEEKERRAGNESQSAPDGTGETEGNDDGEVASESGGEQETGGDVPSDGEEVDYMKEGEEDYPNPARESEIGYNDPTLFSGEENYFGD